MPSGTLLRTQFWHGPRVRNRVLCTHRVTNRLCSLIT